MTDLTSLSDSELDELRLNIITEQERRRRLASFPAMVADITRRFIEDGGDVADISAAVTTATPEVVVIEESIPQEPEGDVSAEAPAEESPEV